MDFKFSSPEQSPGFLLWQLHTIWSRKINQVLYKFNITHVQFVIMANIKWLTLSKKLVTQIEIANLSKIDPVVVSNVLKKLENKKLVKRTPSLDTRFKEVTLTQSGLDLLKPTLSAVENFDKTFFKDCPDLLTIKNGINILIELN